jgi:hypothetical protein
MRGDNSTGLIESTAKWQQVEWGSSPSLMEKCWTS